jgi:integrase
LEKTNVRDPEEGTKNSEVRRVPMIAEMNELLARLRKERRKESPATRVVRISQCQIAMDTAAKKVGIHHLTHHDLRHLFATESSRILADFACGSSNRSHFLMLSKK